MTVLTADMVETTETDASTPTVLADHMARPGNHADALAPPSDATRGDGRMPDTSAVGKQFYSVMFPPPPLAMYTVSGAAPMASTPYNRALFACTPLQCGIMQLVGCGSRDSRFCHPNLMCPDNTPAFSDFRILLSPSGLPCRG